MLQVGCSWGQGALLEPDSIKVRKAPLLLAHLEVMHHAAVVWKGQEAFPEISGLLIFSEVTLVCIRHQEAFDAACKR